jgi:hypothetical protein
LNHGIFLDCLESSRKRNESHGFDWPTEERRRRSMLDHLGEGQRNVVMNIAADGGRARLGKQGNGE